MLHSELKTLREGNKSGRDHGLNLRNKPELKFICQGNIWLCGVAELTGLQSPQERPVRFAFLRVCTAGHEHALPTNDASDSRTYPLPSLTLLYYLSFKHTKMSLDPTPLL